MVGARVVVERSRCGRVDRPLGEMAPINTVTASEYAASKTAATCRTALLSYGLNARGSLFAVHKALPLMRTGGSPVAVILRATEEPIRLGRRLLQRRR